MQEYDYHEVFAEALSLTTQELENSTDSVWLNIQYKKATENEIFCEAPSAFFASQLTGPKKYLIIALQTKINELFGKEIKVSFLLSNKDSSSEIKKHINEEIKDSKKDSSKLKDNTNFSKPTQKISVVHPERKHNKNSSLNENYTVDNYIVGDNNRFAQTIAIAVAKNPGQVYNPLYIFGGTGLGKTHLLFAIGNYINEHSDLKIVYINAEEFLNEYVQSIHSGLSNSQQFRNKYRKADVLLMDDIHSLTSEGVQNELFHIFNALSNYNKQMIFTCDRPLNELNNFQERIISRLSMGSIVDLVLPNFETRCAILFDKLRLMRNSQQFSTEYISDEIVKFIAESIVTNIRDLEGALKDVVGYSSLTKKSLTVDDAKNVLRHRLDDEFKKNFTINDIQKSVANFFNISFSDIKGKKRTKNISMARNVAVYLLNELTEFSSTEIAAEFSRDHSTIIYLQKQARELFKTDPGFVSIVETIKKEIKA